MATIYVAAEVTLLRTQHISLWANPAFWFVKRLPLDTQQMDVTIIQGIIS